MAHNMCPGTDWVPAVIVERLRPLSYLVVTSDHLLWKRHIDILRELSSRQSQEFTDSDAPDPSDIIITRVKNGDNCN